VNLIENGCVLVNSVSEFTAAAPMVFPNPMTDEALIRFDNPSRQPVLFELLDSRGRVVRSEEVNGVELRLQREDLEPGSYVYRLTGRNAQPMTGRLSIH